MRRLDCWDFQVFIANLLDRRGYKVTLGPKGPDGGVDVFAEREGDFGSELTLVSVTHPDEGNKVGLEKVKALHYEVRERGATRGLVATDASFASTALKLIEQVRYQMGAADGEKLRQWLNSRLKSR